MLAFVRWMWANRVPLVPVWLTLATAGAALGIRFGLDAVPRWQVWLLGALCVLPAVIFSLRIRKVWRRFYSLALIGAAIALVVHTQTATREGAAAVAAFYVALGIAIYLGRLADHGLGARVTMEGELRDWSEIGKRIGYAETTWAKTRLIPGQGWRSTLSWPAGTYDLDAVRRDVHKFEGARDLPVGSLKFMPRGRSRNSVDVLCIIDDPNTEAIEWEGPAKTEDYSATDPVRLGKHADGSVVEVTRFRKGKGERRILVGGASESGKSGVMNNFVGEDACRDDVVGLGMDLKGGLELGPWEKVLLWVITDVSGAIEMCAALEAAATYRMGYMKQKGVRVWPVSPELPAIHVNVDEIRKLAGSRSGRSNKQQSELLDRLIDVATQGRALGIGLLAAGQHLTLEALGTSQIRTQFDIRIGLRMNEKESTSYVFPDDPGIRLHEIPADMPGTAYLKDGDKLDPLPHRGFYWSDELVAEIAEMRAGGGAMLDEGTGNAMAAASPLFAEIWGRIRGGDGASLYGDEPGDSAGDSGEAAGGDDVPAALAATAAVQAGTGNDVPWVTVAKLHRERTTPEGAVSPTPMRARPVERLDDAAAMATVWRLLREAGPAGCKPKDLYGPATRKSTWLHKHMTKAIDDGRVVRTAEGTYALAPSAAMAGDAR